MNRDSNRVIDDSRARLGCSWPLGRTGALRASLAALLVLASSPAGGLPGSRCVENSDCAAGSACCGRRATCDVRLVLQDARTPLDLAPFGVSNRAISISGGHLIAGYGETVASFIGADRRDIRRRLRTYLTGTSIAPGDLVVLDMEPGDASLHLLSARVPRVQWEQVIDAYKMRIEVAREELPRGARLALWNVVAPIASGNTTLMENRMIAYREAETRGLYDVVDYLVPNLWQWRLPRDSVSALDPAFLRRVEVTTRLAIEKTLELRRSDGSPGPPLAPMLTFWRRIVGSPGGHAATERIDPAVVNIQMNVIQEYAEYAKIKIIGFWAPGDLRGRHPPVDIRGFLSSVDALPPPACECSAPCVPFGCGAAALGPYPLPPPWGFSPDRRPVKLINVFGGDWEHNVTGNARWWVDEMFPRNAHPDCDERDHLDDGCLPQSPRYTARFDGNGIPDPIDELLSRLDEHHARGWRRFVINRPAGQYQGPGTGAVYASREILPASQYWTMPRWKREALDVHLRRWIDSKRSTGLNDISVGIYVGFRIGEEVCELSSLGRWVPDLTRRLDVCAVHQNLQPWVNMGIREVWFDATAGNIRGEPVLPSLPPKTMLWLSQSPNYRGIVRIGGEALPLEAPGGVYEQPNMYFISRAPFMATWSFYKGRPCSNPGRPCRDPTRWSVPVNSEVGIAFQFRDFPTPAIVQDYVDRGFVPWHWSERRAHDLEDMIRTACGGLAQPCMP